MEMRFFGRCCKFSDLDHLSKKLGYESQTPGGKYRFSTNEKTALTAALLPPGERALNTAYFN
jgi:hypothetical protein